MNYHTCDMIGASVYDGKDIYEISNEDFEFKYRDSKLKGKHDIQISFRG